MPSFFTIGCYPLLDFSCFVSRLQRQDINCVVDIRQQEGIGDFSSGRLPLLLKQQGIVYLPFNEVFDFNDTSIKRRNGSLDYERTIASDSFLQGISRLLNGISKGYVIALLDDNPKPEGTQRFCIISQYLISQGVTVSHFLQDGALVLHESLTQKQSSRSASSKVSHLEANELGRIGEELAVDYLIDKGYSILAMNWNLHHGCELDIIAKKDECIHFVEVKTRRTAFRTTPEQAINYKKFQHITKAANSYRHQSGLHYMPYQFDSIAIVYRAKHDYDITLYENILIFKKRFY